MEYLDYAAAEQMLTAAIASVVGTVAGLLVIALIGQIIFGIFCKKLAGRKGYTGYFWTGFFFGMIGLIYVVGLPDLNIRKDMRAVMKRMVGVSDRVAELEQREFNR